MATLTSDKNKKTKHYQTNQQVKYLHLEAEIEMLLQKVTNLKQKQALSQPEAKS